MMKKTIAILLTGLLLTGCGAAVPDNTAVAEQTAAVETAETEKQESTAGEQDAVAQADSVQTVAGDEQTAEDAQADTSNEETNKEKDISPLVPEISLEQADLQDNDAMKMIKAMKLGWNLGNTLDAYNDGALSDDLTTETCWGNPKATKELIRAVHAAGVETIRIPVSWHNHVDADYNVNSAWMARVKEIVDYAYEDGMYVIINIHHDNHPEAKGIYPDAAHEEQSIKYVSAIWTQVADTFRDYDEHLLFEAMNEPRLVGHQNEWWIDNGSTDCKDAIRIINELNQKFVDIVRSSGGNNEKRYLLCPGYCASPDGVLNAGFQIPEDTQDNHIILEVHAYTPYNFALEYPGISEFDNRKMASYQDIDSFMKNLYYWYVRNGVPVLIDEFGARDKSGNLEDRVRFAAYYTARARSYGMTVCWWDNGAFSGGGEIFGLINRKTGDITYPDIMEALVTYCE